MTKEALRAMLEAKVQETLAVKPDAVVTYASALPVTHRPWKAKPTTQEVAFQEELEKIKAEQDAGEPAGLPQFNQLSIDDFPGLKLPSTRSRAY